MICNTEPKFDFSTKNFYSVTKILGGSFKTPSDRFLNFEPEHGAKQVPLSIHRFQEVCFPSEKAKLATFGQRQSEIPLHYDHSFTAHA